MIGYNILGQGEEKVLILHDYTSDGSSYDSIHPYLDTQKFTYLFADLRGYGKSKSLKGQYTLDEILKDLQELVDHLGWEHFHMVGHSMSAMFIQYYLMHHQDQVLSLTAITPAPACGWQIDEQTQAFIEHALYDKESMQQFLSGFTGGDRLGNLWAKNKVDKWHRVATREAAKGYMNTILTNDFSKEIDGIQTPIMVVVGEYDHPELGEEGMRNTYLKWYPNAKLEFVKNAGHYPMNETPIYLANLLTRFWGMVTPKKAETLLG